MMTTASDSNVRAVAVEGPSTIARRCESDVQYHAFREQVRSRRDSITGRALSRRRLLFTAAIALGTPKRKVAFTVPTGNFGDVFAGYVAARWDFRSTAWCRNNVNDILCAPLRPALTKCAAWSRPRRVMDIQVSSNFERLLFDASGAIRLPSAP